jgi:hypothetical protein
MEAMLGISLYSYIYLKLAKMLCFFIISCVFSSTKLEKRVEQVLPGSRGVGVMGKGVGVRRRNDSGNVYTHE